MSATVVRAVIGASQFSSFSVAPLPTSRQMRVVGFRHQVRKQRGGCVRAFPRLQWNPPRKILLKLFFKIMHLGLPQCNIKPLYSSRHLSEEQQACQISGPALLLSHERAENCQKDVDNRFCEDACSCSHRNSVRLL